jgi:phosphatidylinositol glycan class B
VLRERLALLFGALCVAIRPTSAVLWALVGSIRLVQPPRAVNWTLWYLLLNVIPVVSAVILASCVVDRVMYGEWVFVPLSFARFNVLESKSALFGVQVSSQETMTDKYSTFTNQLNIAYRFVSFLSLQSWHWFVSNGLPTTLGASFPLFLLGLYNSAGRRRLLAVLIGWYILTHSLSPHKEFRFLLPILPLANIYAGLGLQWVSARFFSRPAWACAIFFLLHGPLALYLSTVHQRGPLAIMDVLRRELISTQGNGTAVVSVHFIMPCHSTPLHSHLHVPLMLEGRLSLRTLDCSPDARLSKEGSESDEFVSDPVAFMRRSYAYWRSPSLPTYVVAYDAHVDAIHKWLRDHKYAEISRVFHTHVNGDLDAPETYRSIVLLKRRPV